MKDVMKLMVGKLTDNFFSECVKSTWILVPRTNGFLAWLPNVDILGTLNSKLKLLCVSDMTWLITVGLEIKW